MQERCGIQKLQKLKRHEGNNIRSLHANYYNCLMECVKEGRCYSFSHCAVLGILAEHNCHLKDKIHFDSNGPYNNGKDCKTTYFELCKSKNFYRSDVITQSNRHNYIQLNYNEAKKCPIIPITGQGVCDPGYNICNNCCDLNDDCECDESCDRNEAPNKKCRTDRKIGESIIYPSITV